MLLIASMYSHSFLLQPAGRSRNFNGGNESGNCGDRKPSNPKFTTMQRGKSNVAKWPRNNHSGGFVRWSIASFENSDTLGIFDDPQRVFHYECAEKGCKSVDFPQNPTGGDPSSVENSNLCTGSFVIPEWIPDGKFTVQQTWYGTGNSYGDDFRGQFQFVTCIDIEVSGGTAHTPNAYTSALSTNIFSAQCKSAATFTPGDVTGTVGCKWFTGTTGKVHGCADNACRCAQNAGDDEACYQRGPPPEFCGISGAPAPPVAPPAPTPVKPETPKAPVPTPSECPEDEAPKPTKGPRKWRRRRNKKGKGRRHRGKRRGRKNY